MITGLFRIMDSRITVEGSNPSGEITRTNFELLINSWIGFVFEMRIWGSIFCIACSLAHKKKG